MIRALIVGDADRAEMRRIVRWMEDRVAAGELQMDGEIRGPRSASDRCRVDLIVVLEAHPDEYSIDEVYALFAAAPLARIVCCAGNWCESAGRTRKIWPLAVRVPVDQAIERLEREWALLTEGRMDAYLPPTGSREEWFAAHHPPLNSSPLAPVSGERARERGRWIADSPLVTVLSPDPAYRQMLHDVCTLAGFTVDTESSASPKIVLFDVDPWKADTANDLQRIAESSSVIALTDWPLPEFAAELKSIGAKQVLPKLGDQRQILRALVALATSGCAPLQNSASNVTVDEPRCAGFAE